MESAIQKSRLQQLIEQRNGYLVLAAGLLLLCLLLTVLVFHCLGKTRTVIVPPVIQRSFWVGEQTVSPEYLSEMTAFLAQLRLTITPSNAEYQRDLLLRYVDPRTYGALKNELIAETDHLTQDHINLAFYPSEIRVDVPHFTARITGDLNSTVGDSPLPPQRITYRLMYRYDQGRLLLQSFQEEEKAHV